jgi:hypothetical protein
MSSGGDDKQSWMRLRAADLPVIAEIRGRRVNEAIERGARGQGHAVFLCECGILGCSRTIELPLAEYAAVRQGFDRFLIAPGHELVAVDRVVEEHEAYCVVVKRSGRPAELAKATDPRGGDDG